MTKIQKETMSILFFIKRAKLLRNGEAPICVRVTVNKQAVEIRIKRSVSADKWCQTKGCAKGKDRESKELNSFLDAVRLKILQIHRDIELEAVSMIHSFLFSDPNVRYRSEYQLMVIASFFIAVFHKFFGFVVIEISRIYGCCFKQLTFDNYFGFLIGAVT